MPPRVDFSGSQYIVSRCNHDAVKLAEDIVLGVCRYGLITGAAECGKSHLAFAVGQHLGVGVIAADRLDLDLPDSSGVPWLVDQLERIATDRDRQEVLAHLFNREGGRLLMFSRSRPTEWSDGLADFCSRVVGLCGHARIEMPDDSMLVAVLEKQARDYGFTLPEEVRRYFVERMPRSYEGAQTLIAALNRVTLARQHKVSLKSGKLALEACGF